MKGFSSTMTQAIEVEASNNTNMEANANEGLPTAVAQAKDIEVIGNVDVVTTRNIDARNANAGDEIVLIVDRDVT